MWIKEENRATCCVAKQQLVPHSLSSTMATWKRTEQLYKNIQNHTDVDLLDISASREADAQCEVIYINITER